MEKPKIRRIDRDKQIYWRVSCGDTDRLYEDLESAAQRFELLCKKYQKEGLNIEE